MTPDPSAAAVIDLYRRKGTAWDRLRGTSLMEKDWLDRFASLLPSGGDVLDLGCGGGAPIASYLAKRGFSITGVDTSRDLLDLFGKRLPEQTSLESDMRCLALDRTFDGIIAWNSFFHLSPADQRAMFGVFARHAGDRAALMFTSGPAAGEAIGQFDGEPLYHASLDPSDYESLLAAHGFDVVSYKAEDPDCGRHTVWLARRNATAR